MPVINVHPLFVHFPIALLSIYTVFEVFRLPLLNRQPWVFNMKAMLLFLGVLGGFTAGITGKLASQAYVGTTSMNIVNLHATFAISTVCLYSLLAVLYLLEWLTRSGSALPGLLARLDHALFRAPLLILLSLLGLTLITITGALGGALVYGPNVDPVVHFIYNLFFPS